MQMIARISEILCVLALDSCLVYVHHSLLLLNKKY